MFRVALVEWLTRCPATSPGNPFGGVGSNPAGDVIFLHFFSHNHQFHFHLRAFLDLYNVSTLTLYALLSRNGLDMIRLLISVKGADGYVGASDSLKMLPWGLLRMVRSSV